MGSEYSNHLIEHPLPRDYKRSPNNPNLYISVVNKTKIHKNIISIQNHQDLQYEQEMFIFRKCHSDHIIQAKYFQNMSYAEYCSKLYQICYYTEYPEYFFNEIKPFPFLKGFYYLIDALKGFQILTKKVGWFKVTPKMITFDKDYRIKVWLSENFSETKIDLKNRLINEAQFILNVVEIFDTKIRGTDQHTYYKLINNNSKVDFEQLRLGTVINILISLSQKKQFLESLEGEKQNKIQKYTNKSSKKQNYQELADKNKKCRSLKRNLKDQNVAVRETPQSPLASSQVVRNGSHYMSLSESYKSNSFPTKNIDELKNNQTINQNHSDFTFQSDSINNQSFFNLQHVFNGQTARNITPKIVKRSMEDYQICNFQQLNERKMLIEQKLNKNNPNQKINHNNLIPSQPQTRKIITSNVNHHLLKENRRNINQINHPSNKKSDKKTVEWLDLPKPSNNSSVLSPVNSNMLHQATTIKSIACSDNTNDQNKPESVIIYDIKWDFEWSNKIQQPFMKIQKSDVTH